MKYQLLKSYAILMIGIVSQLTVSCKEDESTEDPVQRGWVASYTNVSMGAQDNYTLGHFFKPQTGESIKLENTADQQQKLAMMFFTESGGANTFITFPANGAAASTFGTSTIRLFTQANGGINFWSSSNLVSGMLTRSSMTSLQFDNLVANKNWDNFNSAFKNYNNGNENLTYKLSYDLNPTTNVVYLVQINGLIRAIMCIRGVVPTSSAGGSIRFDILVEGHDKYANSPSATYIMPAFVE